MEGFVGNGALKRVIPKLIEEGWDDVPTLKLMKSEDMDAINLTQQQKDALEMRSYLHNRALIQYGDKLEFSGKSLQELLGLSIDEISSQFGMKRGHVARFMEKRTCNSSTPNPLQQPPLAVTSSKKATKTSSNNSTRKASKMDPELYKEAMGGEKKMGGEEKPELFPQISWSSQLFSWINWSSGRDTKSSKEKMGGKENEDNNDDVHNLMQRINDPQLELQFTSNKNTVLHVVAQFGNYKYVKIILEKSSLSLLSSLLLRCLNMDGETPLHIAAREGHLDIVKALIVCANRLGREAVEEMLRAPNKDNDTALHMAVRNRYNADVVEWLTKEDPEFTHPPNNAKETPLYLAAERQDEDMVSMILKNCRSPAYGGPKGHTALHVAATDRRDIEITKLLLEWKLDLIKETNEYGRIPLHYAVRDGNQYGVKLMLEKDKSVAYITTDDGDEKTPLHIAASHGNVNAMEELLLCCPDCWEMVNSKGQNILHIAVDEKHEGVIEYISKKSWIIHLINQKDIEGNTPLHLIDPAFRLQILDLWYHPRSDRHAANNNNDTPEEIRWSSTTKEYSSIGGRRNIRKEESKMTEARDKETRKAAAEKRKARNEELKKMGDTHMIVATLIATITFAAGFTMPGGYNSNEGSNQGMPLLLREAAFKVFVITNTVAVICSTSSAFLYVTASLYYVRRKDDMEKLTYRYVMALTLILIAVAAMIVAFIAGSFAVLVNSLGLAISVCVISCISLVIYFMELKKLTRFERILKIIYEGIFE